MMDTLWISAYRKPSIVTPSTSTPNSRRPSVAPTPAGTEQPASKTKNTLNAAAKILAGRPIFMGEVSHTRAM